MVTTTPKFTFDTGQVERPAHALLIMLTVAALGCGEVVTPPTETRMSALYVTGEAAAHLDKDGHFVLATPERVSRGEQITSEKAVALAEMDVRYYEPALLGSLEAMHGGAIQLRDLRPCGRIYYAASPYRDLTRLEKDFRVLRKQLGDKWLVSFCAPSGVPQVSIAVSAYAIDVQVAERGLTWTGEGGNEFFSNGIPLGAAIPVSPERAVEIVAMGTGKRATKVPELVIPGPFVAGQAARWMVTLEGPGQVRGKRTGTHSGEVTLFVGRDDRDAGGVSVFRATKGPLTPEVLHVTDDRGVTSPRHDVLVERRAGVPRDFEPVDFQGREDE